MICQLIIGFPFPRVQEQVLIPAAQIVLLGAELFVIKGSESSTITGLNIIDTVAPASNAANYNITQGLLDT